MTHHDLRLGEQRGNMRRVRLIVEDRSLQRRLHFGENSRCDASGKMAEKQGFHSASQSSKYEKPDCRHLTSRCNELDRLAAQARPPRKSDAGGNRSERKNPECRFSFVPRRSNSQGKARGIFVEVQT